MGVDFLKSKAKIFTKGWDLDRLELSRRNLFTKEPEAVESRAVARLKDGAALNAGDDVVVRIEGQELLLLRDLSVRAECVKPAQAIINAVLNAGGYARGKIAVVFPTLNLVEVVIQ